MIKVLVRAEVGTRDDAILHRDDHLLTKKKLEKALTDFAAQTKLPSQETIPFSLIALFFEGQLYIDPVDRSRFPGYTVNKKGEAVDVPIIVDTFGIAFDTDSSSDVAHVMSQLGSDTELARFKGLGWKFFDKDTDLPVSARN